MRNGLTMKDLFRLKEEFYRKRERRFFHGLKDYRD
jgi:hypothetical protein